MSEYLEVDIDEASTFVQIFLCCIQKSSNNKRLPDNKEKNNYLVMHKRDHKSSFDKCNTYFAEKNEAHMNFVRQNQLKKVA